MTPYDSEVARFCRILLFLLRHRGDHHKSVRRRLWSFQSTDCKKFSISVLTHSHQKALQLCNVRREPEMSRHNPSFRTEIISKPISLSTRCAPCKQDPIASVHEWKRHARAIPHVGQSDTCFEPNSHESMSIPKYTETNTHWDSNQRASKVYSHIPQT